MAERAGAYPVQFSVDRPERFQRVQLLLRLALWLALYWFGSGLGWFVYLGGPIITAVLVAQRGGRGFQERHGERYRKALSFIMGVNAYLLFASDGLPIWGKEGPTRLRIESTGTPTVGSALVRLIRVIPHGVVLVILWVVAGIAALVALFTIVVSGSVPEGIRRFQIGVLVWEAWTLAYLVSMVEEYPPFRFEAPPAGSEGAASGS